MPHDKPSNQVIVTYQVVFFVAAACFGVRALVKPTATVCTMSRTAIRPRGGIHERLNQQRFRRDDKDKRRVAVLDVPRLSLKLLACPPVKLLHQLVEIACCVRRVAVKVRCVAPPDPPGVHDDDDLSRDVLAEIVGLFFASDATRPPRMSLTVTSGR